MIINTVIGTRKLVVCDVCVQADHHQDGIYRLLLQNNQGQNYQKNEQPRMGVS